MTRRIQAIIAVFSLFAASHADAQTTIPGGNIVSATWSLVGSPYIVQGDVTIPAGGMLTIQAGVTVRFEPADALGSGTDTARTELRVEGTLNVVGDSASPVVFEGVNPAIGSWYGLIALAGSNVAISFAEVRGARYAISSYEDITLSDVLLQGANARGMEIYSGTATVDRLRATETVYGIYVRDAGQLVLDNAIIWNQSSDGINIRMGASSNPTTINQATIVDCADGVEMYSTSSSRQSTISNSIVVNNRARGLYRSNVGILNGRFSNLWGNSSGNSTGASLTSTLSANPLFVGASNFRITSHSPARQAGETGLDIGALPYTTDPTVGIQGTFFNNTTWNLAGSPYVVIGDIIVPSGVTFAIEPGVVVRFAATDSMASGTDTARVEFRNEGTLNTSGTGAAPVVFEAQSGAVGSWYGVIALAGSTTSLTGTHIMETRYAISSYEDITLSDVLLQGANARGMEIYSGTATVDRLRATETVYGIYVRDAGQLDLDNAIIWNQSSDGINIRMGASSNPTTINQATIVDCADGVEMYSTSSSRQSTISNSIVVNNRARGLYRSNVGILNGRFSDLWGNSSGNSTGASLTSTLSANPLFVGASNFRITSHSPARQAGETGLDIGALPYTTDPTSGIQGTFFDNTTWNLAGSPYVVTGDIIVPSGVTFAIEPGVVVRFAATDSMASGTDTARVEFRNEGTLNTSGTGAAPVVFEAQSGAVGSWYGVIALAGSTTSLTGTHIMETRYAISSYEDITLNDVLLQGANARGMEIYSGTATVDRLRATETVYGIYVRDAGQLVLDNAIIWNQSSDGINIRMGASSSPSTIHSSTIVDCADGVEMYSTSSSRQSTVTNSIVVNNRARGLYRSNVGILNGRFSDLWGNSSGNSTGASLTSTLSANPLFVGATDFHLTSTSVAIDSGTNTDAPARDADGVARPLDGNGIGGAEYDMGAYEFVAVVECGNGVTETGEVCDDGLLNGTYGACAAGCGGLGPRCGDSVTNGPEDCDDGNMSNTDACLNTCMAATCGDGLVRAGAEDCDDGNRTDTDSCTNMCRTARCGDGSVQAGIEQCDDGNTSNTDGCAMCQSARCGDGYTQAGVEQCDDANMTNTDSCVACMSARCGDGFIQEGVESCDDGNTMGGDTCPATCAPAVCGDGVVDGGEACDDGNRVNGDGCTNACEMARCGDGIVYMGMEACDDGNSVQTDGCLNSCLTASCGDGFVRTGVETCDDGNDNDDDGCTTMCTLRSCGDGTVQAGEVCDDGNASNTDECLNTCQSASCGDGFRFVGSEACDDGNTSDADECLATCQSASCGDGFVWDGAEDCDDGNGDDGDGCDAMCMVEDPSDPDAGVSDGGVADGGPMDGSLDALDMDAAGDASADAGGGRGDGGGCGCAVPGGSRSPTRGLLLLVALGALGLRRQRRR